MGAITRKAPSTILHAATGRASRLGRMLKYLMLQSPAHYEVGSELWLAAMEKHFGGLATGVKRNVVSPLDPRSADEINRGGMIGGDRMVHHGYGAFYSHFLQPYLATRETEVTVVEVGILRGTGLALWSALFPNGNIVGLDIDLDHFRRNLPALKSRGAFAKKDPELHHFDQFKDGPARLVEIMDGRKIDIVIDDGFHSPTTILNTVRAVKPFLAPRFVYFIEDCEHAGSIIRGEFSRCLIDEFGELTVVRSPG